MWTYCYISRWRMPFRNWEKMADLATDRERKNQKIQECFSLFLFSPCSGLFFLKIFFFQDFVPLKKWRGRRRSSSSFRVGCHHCKNALVRFFAVVWYGRSPWHDITCFQNSARIRFFFSESIWKPLSFSLAVSLFILLSLHGLLTNWR